MNRDDPLLQILACPLDKGPLHLVVHDEEETRPDTATAARASESLYNPRLHRRYPIVDGIPQLLPSSGEQVTEDEHEKLSALLKGMSS
ncbi:Trm112 family protein [Streptomyces europaeiscabiei]|uniref:Trm112 family protein n=1 Tax=Streptomyces europaeiscabiei TaxID=146819 RepID=A0ABU4NAG2_9ACTN|nr:Trm112 family protein [Streptomyces europaeiscabiei]MDX2523923.1 Trm112 family protein [Streptomyces europaeiscabiei]MDX2765333.1 Trm112 family protein [Streptomyces europaeiscabiei]MDX3545197.1 Trm112 family protein [Streptomyces europaeiscabiei]MDX3554188.1 Trm112 family protein [Streptomyces europaeiscabiei]MDX3699561.1 Trm112 family protein [Streptomyces europaeiscabiei]